MDLDPRAVCRCSRMQYQYVAVVEVSMMRADSAKTGSPQFLVRRRRRNSKHHSVCCVIRIRRDVWDGWGGAFTATSHRVPPHTAAWVVMVLQGGGGLFSASKHLRACSRARCTASCYRSDAD